MTLVTGDGGNATVDTASRHASTARTVSKNLFWLLAGSLLSQVLRIFYVAVLARYVGATGFGQISTATTLMSLLILVVNFGLDTLAVRDMAARPERAGSVVSSVAALRLALAVVLVAALAVVVKISPYDESTCLIIGIYGLVYLLDSFADVARSVFSASQRMEYRSAVDLSRDVFNVAVSLLGILLGWSLIAIVWVSALASLVKLVLSVWLMRTRFVRPSARVDLSLCKYMVSSALPFLALVCISVASARVNVVILSWVDTPAAVGIYSAAVFVIAALLTLPEMFMESIFPLFSQLRERADDTLTTAYRTSYKFMLMVGCALGTGTVIASARLLTLLYGPAFEPAAAVAGLLSIQLFTMVGYVNGAYLNATHRQGLFAILRVGSVTLVVVLCLVLIPQQHYVGAASAVAISSTIDFVLYSLLCHHYARVSLPWLTILRISIASAAMAAASLAVVRLGIDPIVGVMPGVIVYLTALGLLGAIGREEKEFVAGIVSSKRLLRPLGALLQGSLGMR